MTDRFTPDDPGHERGPESRPGSEENLQSLRARLDELQQSVEHLGTQASWDSSQESEPPGYAIPPPAYPPTHAPAPGAYSPQPPTHQPPASVPVVDPYAPAPPAATNGHGDPEAETSEVSARWATVAIVEAGPFADLIELRHFEDDLAGLAAVSDVHVRRFGHNRATIEVGLTGPYPLARELFQLNRPMELSDGPEGEVLIELVPTEAADEPEPPAESRGEAG